MKCGLVRSFITDTTHKLSPVTALPDDKTRLIAGLSGLNCESEAAFRALLGELLSAFFGMDKNIVRVAEFFVPSVSDSAEAVTIIGFDAGNGIQGFVIDLSL